MEPVVTSAVMKACDGYAIKHLGIPGILLMENAGSSVARAVTDLCHGRTAGAAVLIFCGGGNNGGDGFVVARHCLASGMKPSVVLTSPAAKLTGEARLNFAILQKIVKDGGKNAACKIIRLGSATTLKNLPEPDIIVDALFGTGFHGHLSGMPKAVVEWINASRAKKVSIDIPSGLDSDTGSVGNVAVRADYTVTMGLRKTGLLLQTGPDYAGEVIVADIGIPPQVLKKHGTVQLSTAEDIAAVLPARPRMSHKHSVGKVLVIAGARGYTGAAAMTSLAAMRTGAGSVILCVPESISQVLARKLTEVMVTPMPETPDGTLAVAAAGRLRKHLEWADSVIIGPGLGRHPETAALVEDLLAAVDLSIVLDADGINNLEGGTSYLKRRKSSEIVLTPHVGELAKLTGTSARDIESNRIKICVDTAKQLRSVLLLKGAPTVVSDGLGNAVINSTGNPGMATAGSGDVLSGIIGALMAQGTGPAQSAWAGAWIHGRAGDLAREEIGERGMMAGDIGDRITEVLRQLAGITPAG